MSTSHRLAENLNITGCAIALFQGTNQVMICEENRVVLSYAEQKELGSKQPFMLPTPTLDHEGKPIELTRLGRLIHAKMNKKTEIVPNISDKQALEIVAKAKSNHQRFAQNNRYFQHVVLRERFHEGESYQDACKRLLREEFYRKFKVLHHNTTLYIKEKVLKMLYLYI